MKPLKNPTNKEMSDYMRMRQYQNRAVCVNNGNENWMCDKLTKTRFRWTRQATWGYRLFDFWCAELGIAIEVDGAEHNHGWDKYRDEYNFRRSAILVFRVKNRNEDDAEKVLSQLERFGSWEERRELLGLTAATKVEKRWLASQPYGHSFLNDYLNGQVLSQTPLFD